MKRKITIQLSEEVAEQLEVAAERPGASKSAIVEAALNRFLSADHEAVVDDAALLRRLDWMSGQLERLDRDLRVVGETAALHARYHLTVAPPLPVADHRAACELGAERFEVFAAQVGRRVHLRTPLMRETIDRVSTTDPGLFARDMEQGVPLGAHLAESEPDIPASTVADEAPELLAVVREGDSNGVFPEKSRSPAR
jgi:predicted transcriptional regulator